MQVEFHRSLYSEDAVRQAAQAFAGVATLSVQDLGHALKVDVSAPHPAYTEVQVVDALANYVLQATVRGRK